MTRSRGAWVAQAVPLGIVTVPALTALLLLAGTGVLPPANPTGLPDPGWLTHWGIPASRALRDAAAAVAIGCLVVATVLVPGAHDAPGRLSAAQNRLRRVAGAFLLAWCAAATAEIVLLYSDLSGEPAGRYGLTEIWFFITEIDYGQVLLASLLLAVFAGCAVSFVRSVSGLGAAVLVALAALWPVALTGHAAGETDHELGVNLQFAHLVAVSIWAGGLAALGLVGPRFRTTQLLRGFSRLAGWCVLVVALSGLLVGVARLPTLSSVTSTYGALLAMKIVASGLCLGFGWWHRYRVLAVESYAGRRRFGALVTGELLVMAVAIGTGVALGRTPPPERAQAVLTPAEAILGHPMPPPLDPNRWLTQWRFDSLWGSIAIIAVVFYMLGVVRLVRRGDGWGSGRTACWISGWLVFFWSTSGPPGSYGEVLFSMHMLQHMTIATIVPVLLVLGAPVSLALRALRPRTDGSRGPREWVLVAVTSLPMRALSHPLVAAGLFIVGPFAFYYTGLFELAISTHTGHILMTTHFLVSGYLFANVICGIDPGPRRPHYMFRVLGEFNRSSQHPNAGGGWGWRQRTGVGRRAMRPRSFAGSGVLIGRCDRRCVRPVGRTRHGWCSASSGG